MLLNRSKWFILVGFVLSGCATQRPEKNTPLERQPLSTSSPCANEQRPKAVGNYWKGELQDGLNLTEALQLDNIEFLSTPEHAYATQELCEVLLDTALWMQKEWNGEVKLKIGDVAKEGGKRLGRHYTHQTGLDADVSYIPVVEQVGKHRWYRSNNRFSEKYVTRKKRAYRVSDNFDVAKNYATLQHIVENFHARIFVDQKLIQVLRNYGRENNLPNEFLGSIGHAKGHTDHFHVKLICPDTQPDCKNQARSSFRSKKKKSKKKSKKA